VLLLTLARTRTFEEMTKQVPTETPPPYFPQGSLSPPDEKTRRRMRWTLYG
jgi:hypothetical protein